MDAYSKTELRQLSQKANDFVTERRFDLEDCDNLVRDKDEEYFRDVFLKDGGILKPRNKDNHGDPRCPVNGKLKGLFLTPLREDINGQNSIYGDKRLIIAAADLIKPTTRAYFADFYCILGRSKAHYVCVVLTENNTEADRMCRKRLVTLQINNNHFFQARIKGKSGVKMIKSAREKRGKLHIELFYTEPIDILKDVNCAVFRNFVSHTGSNGRHPKVKNTTCQLCNIDTEEQDNSWYDDESGDESGYIESDLNTRPNNYRKPFQFNQKTLSRLPQAEPVSLLLLHSQQSQSSIVSPPPYATAGIYHQMSPIGQQSSYQSPQQVSPLDNQPSYPSHHQVSPVGQQPSYPSYQQGSLLGQQLSYATCHHQMLEPLKSLPPLISYKSATEVIVPYTQLPSLPSINAVKPLVPDVTEAESSNEAATLSTPPLQLPHATQLPCSGTPDYHNQHFEEFGSKRKAEEPLPGNPSKIPCLMAPLSGSRELVAMESKLSTPPGTQLEDLTVSNEPTNHSQQPHDLSIPVTPLSKRDQPSSSAINNEAAVGQDTPGSDIVGSNKSDIQVSQPQLHNLLSEDLLSNWLKTLDDFKQFMKEWKDVLSTK